MMIIIPPPGKRLKDVRAEESENECINWSVENLVT